MKAQSGSADKYLRAATVDLQRQARAKRQGAWSATVKRSATFELRKPLTMNREKRGGDGGLNRARWSRSGCREI